MSGRKERFIFIKNKWVGEKEETSLGNWENESA